MSMTFEPFSTILQAYRNLYPDAYVPDVRVQPLEHLGAAVYPDDGSPPWIALATELPLVGACDILCHELAHVATCTEHQEHKAAHGPEWQQAYEAIIAEYERLLSERGEGYVEVPIPGAEPISLGAHGQGLGPEEEIRVAITRSKDGGLRVECRGVEVEVLRTDPVTVRLATPGAVDPMGLGLAMEVILDKLGLEAEKVPS